jgi:chromosome condensin MukBEF MukE localization factor
MNPEKGENKEGNQAQKEPKQVERNPPVILILKLIKIINPKITAMEKERKIKSKERKEMVLERRLEEHQTWKNNGSSGTFELQEVRDEYWEEMRAGIGCKKAMRAIKKREEKLRRKLVKEIEEERKEEEKEKNKETMEDPWRGVKTNKPL